MLKPVGERNLSDSSHKMHQIRFPPGLRPGPRWGSSRRSPDPLSVGEGDTPSSFSSPSAPTAPRFSHVLGGPTKVKPTYIFVSKI